MNHFNLAYKLHIQPDLELCQTGYSNYSKASISKSLANGVGILDFWQKRLKHPSDSLANDLTKYGNLTKTLPHHAYMTTWERAWQILSLLACCVLTTKIKSSPCLHADYYFFLFCQVRNSKLLEKNCVFLLNK